jgi:hypothetical protein
MLPPRGSEHNYRKQFYILAEGDWQWQSGKAHQSVDNTNARFNSAV